MQLMKIINLPSLTRIPSRDTNIKRSLDRKSIYVQETKLTITIDL